MVEDRLIHFETSVSRCCKTCRITTELRLYSASVLVRHFEIADTD